MALIKCEECGVDLLVDGVEKFESKEVNARVDNCPNCGAGLMTKKEKIGLKSRNLEQVRKMSTDKRPKRPKKNPSKESRLEDMLKNEEDENDRTDTIPTHSNFECYYYVVFLSRCFLICGNFLDLLRGDMKIVNKEHLK